VQKTCRAFEQEAVEAYQKVFGLAEQIVYPTSVSWTARKSGCWTVGVVGSAGGSASACGPICRAGQSDGLEGQKLRHGAGWQAQYRSWGGTYIRARLSN
jgi:hypothetical protein